MTYDIRSCSLIIGHHRPFLLFCKYYSTCNSSSQRQIFIFCKKLFH
nr:MAG TPA: hypothetical protein [Caudoviricetes sp.]